MNLAAIRSFLFRHGEKLILGAVLLFVCHRIYANLFPPVGAHEGLPPPLAATPPRPTEAIRGSFRETAGPFVEAPAIEKARYNWFYPPDTRWGRPVELEMPRKDATTRDDVARIPVGARVLGMPTYVPMSDEEVKERHLPAPPDDLTESCKIDIKVEPGAGREGDTLVVQAQAPGRWVKVIATLVNQDRFCVAILVNRPGVRRDNLVPPGIIKEVKEEPLGTVVIRFTAKQGTDKSADGLTWTNWVEPTYFEVLRKGEFDAEELAIGRVPGRFPKPAEPGAAPGPTPPRPKAPDTTGFPGAHRPPAKAEPPPLPRKGPEPGTPPDELVFRDNDAEAETNYVYRIRSVVVPTEETPPLKEPVVHGPHHEYRTLEKFSFAFIGGDAARASIAVFIGPRDNPLGMRIFERIPVGGWIGNVPKEFQPQHQPAPHEPPKAEAPKDSEPQGDGEPATPRTAPEDEPATRYVTRYILVDVELDVLRLVEQTITQPDGLDALGRAKFKTVVSYLEKWDRRAILRDRRNRLHYLWLEPRSALPSVSPPAEKTKGR